MRRLAKDSRNDNVASRRDYQTVEEARTWRYDILPGGGTLAFATEVDPAGGPQFVGIGGYIRTAKASSVTLRVSIVGGKKVEAEIPTDRRLHRFGILVPSAGKSIVRVQLEVPEEARFIELWGLNAAAVKPIATSLDEKTRDDLLKAPHLAPETFFIPHEAPYLLSVDQRRMAGVEGPVKGNVVYLKKCAYCQRKLPIDPARLGGLAFHKHNAKISKHQNECRACKKWRINDRFNPVRSVDQLHESSVITRERKLLLREPEILQRIKDRRGDGLKSIIWKRFSKKCFRCRKSLKLSEVQLDHTRPLAYLWPIDEHATCLCATCNNFKKDKFPVDAYTEEQLVALSGITGLNLAVLREKKVNKAELERIVDNIVTFATSVDARTFNAVARKVSELRPDVDLYSRLGSRDSRALARVRKELAERPED